MENEVVPEGFEGGIAPAELGCAMRAMLTDWLTGFLGLPGHEAASDLLATIVTAEAENGVLVNHLGPVLPAEASPDEAWLVFSAVAAVNLLERIASGQPAETGERMRARFGPALSMVVMPYLPPGALLSVAAAVRADPAWLGNVFADRVGNA